MYIPRHLEFVVSRLSARKPVIVLTGARQVGKSTMLKTFFPHVNYIALDHPLLRQPAIIVRRCGKTRLPLIING